MTTMNNAPPINASPGWSRALVKGLSTGLILQLAIGPVFFYVVNLVLTKTVYDGIAAVFAVTLVDYLYISLSIIGVKKLLEMQKYQKTIGIVSSIVLIIFGAATVVDTVQFNAAASVDTGLGNSWAGGVFSSFLSAAILTISNPLTILFFTGVFAARAVDDRFSKTELYIFGFAVGMATFIFMGFAVVVFSLLKGAIPMVVIQVLNLLVGLILISYGVIRAIKIRTPS